MNAMIPKIDLSVRAIDQWNAYSEEEKVFWSEFFSLQSAESSQDSSGPYVHPYSYQLEKSDVVRIVFCAVVEILRYNKENNMARAYVGNSGGLDSATTCGLLAGAVKLSKELGEDFEVIAYGMPLHSNPEHNLRASETAKQFGIRHITVENLDAVLDTFKTALVPLAEEYKFSEEEVRRGFGNVKARLRMIVNFFGTTKAGSYVVSTDNLSELYMAFWTLMGDVGAFGPIQNILKGLELPAVARALGVPENTVSAKPTDGLEVHKSLDELEGGDSDAFGGIAYPHLDAIICHAAANGFDLEEKKDVHVAAEKIQHDRADQERVDQLVATMQSPASIWKRTKGSIGVAITREELGLPPVGTIAPQLP